MDRLCLLSLVLSIKPWQVTSTPYLTGSENPTATGFARSHHLPHMMVSNGYGTATDSMGFWESSAPQLPRAGTGGINALRVALHDINPPRRTFRTWSYTHLHLCFTGAELIDLGSNGPCRSCPSSYRYNTISIHLGTKGQGKLGGVQTSLRSCDSDHGTGGSGMQ